MSVYRVLVLTRYYFNSLRRNKGRFLEIFIWPVFELFVLGFLANYIKGGGGGGGVDISLLLVGNFILWVSFSRMSNEVVQQVFDDVLSRNFQNILITPVSFVEMVWALFFSALLKVLLNLAVVGVIAQVIYRFNILDLGPVVVPAYLILLSWGLAIGLAVSSLVFVFGTKAGAFAWTIAGLAQPFSCVFYPREVLPGVAKSLSYAVPISYVFENIRNSATPQSQLAPNWTTPLMLVLMYFALSVILILVCFQYSRKSGVILRI